MRNIQLNEKGQLKHFLTIDGLKYEILKELLENTQSLVSSIQDKSIKKLPLLRGITVVNMFFEPSTRTRTTFEIAAKRLSADVLNINISTSATTKGESLLDTLHNLQAMYADMFIVRHASSGAAHFIANNVASHISVINAGDGSHAHPTQALLDLYTIYHYKKELHTLKVAIVGDILHSRVARSQIQALQIMQVPEIRVIAPKTLLPGHTESLGVHVYHSLDQGLRDVDVIIMLRLQNERMQGGFLPEDEYFHYYGLTPARLHIAKEDAIVMHPGPINRGVEVDSVVADGIQSVILQQVSFGIAVRMAVIAKCMGTTISGVGTT